MSGERVSIESADGVVVARLRGEVDLNSVEDIAGVLLPAVPNDALGLVIDLGETTYLDSAGVRLLFDILQRLNRRQQQMRISVPGDAPLRRVLSVVAIETEAPLCSAVSEGVAEIRSA